MPQLKLRIVGTLLCSGHVPKEGTSAFPLTVQWARTGSAVCWRCLREWCQRALISPVGRWWKGGLEGSDRNNEDEVLLKFCTWLIVRRSLLCKAKAFHDLGAQWRQTEGNAATTGTAWASGCQQLVQNFGEKQIFVMLKWRRLTRCPRGARQAFALCDTSQYCNLNHE